MGPPLGFSLPLSEAVLSWWGGRKGPMLATTAAPAPGKSAWAGIPCSSSFSAWLTPCTPPSPAHPLAWN